MKAIILAAGYATRLRPLTDTMAKPLLPIGGRPMIDYLYDKIAEVMPIDQIHVVTNHKFAAQFSHWAEGHYGQVPILVHDDGTLNNEDRKGAIGDIQYTVEEAKLSGEDLLIIAGDNLFDFSLNDMVRFWRTKENASCLALYQCQDMELVKQYSIVDLDAEGRITSFTEKPKNPTTNLVGTATYLYHHKHAALIVDYLKEGNSPDQPGNLVAWLHRRVPIYGYRFDGSWLDIGNQHELLEADNTMRRRSSLPARPAYKLD